MGQRESMLAVPDLVVRMRQELEAHLIGEADHRLPSEPQLMQRYQVTRYTLREALSRLSQMGYLYQSHGRGTFVRPGLVSSAVPLQSPDSFTAEMAQLGRRLATVDATQTAITAQAAEFLPLVGTVAPETPLLAVTRWRTLDGVPYVLERSYYLKRVVPAIPQAVLFGSLFDYVQKNAGLKLGFQDKQIAAGCADPDAAQFFALPEGSPQLVMQDDSYLSAGDLFAWSKQCFDYRNIKLFVHKRL